MAATVILATGVAIGRLGAPSAARGSAAPTTSTTTTVAPWTPANPALDQDFPDPDVTRLDDGSYIAFATNSGSMRIQMSRSDDLRTWSAPVEVLSEQPGWAHPTMPDLWAPAYVEHDGRHLLFFALRGATSGRHCIGVASADAPTGPYTPVGDEPVMCMQSKGGAIDPFVYEDDSGAYLLWKNDGNCCGMSTSLWSQPINLSTLALSGVPSELIQSNDEEEQGIVEAPEMILHDGQLLLLYSSGRYADDSYAVRFAVCVSAAGPCERTQRHPILGSTTTVRGPGGQSVVETDDGTVLAYHAWGPSAPGYESGGYRSLRLDRLVFADNQPIVIGPTTQKG